MTPSTFRRLALSLPDAVKGAHMGQADFRVGGKICATRNADETPGTARTGEFYQLRMAIAVARF